jgi:NtrC-family two-component system response regulator AlgB
MHILIIDDEATLRRSLRIALESMGHQAKEAADSVRARELLRAETFDLAFLDLRLGPDRGIELLPELRRDWPDLEVVVVTAYATIETAVEAMRQGALDFLPKPFTPDQLRAILARREQLHRLRSRVTALEDQVRDIVPEADLKTVDAAMKSALDLALKAAPSEAAILLRGESGTGKGVLARVIHSNSRRASAPFVTLHCPSLSAELLESELFGHVRGAFTGAVRDTVGKVGMAEGGTLFLDEIGDLPLAVQPKLLYLLQEKRYERVGDPNTRTADVRILAATNRKLEADVAAGRFREDLLYRINVIEVTLPPLRERVDDVLPLAEHLLQFFARQSGKAVTGFTEEARALIRSHPWPGNVRELRNAVERGVILASGDRVGLADLPSHIGATTRAEIEIGGRVTLTQLEIEHIRRVLASSTTLDEAANILGINPSTLYRKRKDYGL